MAFTLEKIVRKAYTSKFYLELLNYGLWYKIPFNKPHRLRIKSLSENSITVHIPYIRKNLNHLKGIHACALATASEYACGFLLISRLSSSKYRLIMRNMNVDFIKQGKEDLFVNFKLEENRIEEIKSKLSKEPQCLEILEVEVRDAKQNLISVAKLEWQLKDWKQIKN
jgi:acyl-coenzyme A thioesterase PaaI-like protein